MSNIENHLSPQLSAETAQLISEASSYEEMALAAERIGEDFGVENASRPKLGEDNPSGAFLHDLRMFIECFTRKGGCDTFAKALVESSLIEESGIPKEFLLKAIQVGALKELMDNTANRNFRNHGAQTTKSVADNLGYIGFDWAAKKLDGIKSQEEAAKQQAAEQAEIQKGVQLQEALAYMAANRNNPEFNLSSEQQQAIHSRVEQKILTWKVFADGHTKSKLNQKGESELEGFKEENGNKEWTAELAKKFGSIIKNPSNIKEHETPESIHCPDLEIVNPDSPWFTVLVLNGYTTVASFMSAAANNMAYWFKLEPQEKRGN